MSNYWIDRIEHQNEVNFQKTTAAADKKLAELYRRTANSLLLDITALYDKFDKKPEEVLVNDLYKNNQYYFLLGQINQKLTALGEEEIKIISAEMLKLYEETSKVVQNQAGFQVSFEDSAQDALNRIWCPDGKHWSSRVWKNKAEMQQRLEQGIIDCVSRGLSKDKVVTEIADLVGKDRSKAERLVRTELTFVQNEAAADTYQKAGITHYKFISAKDSRVSKECKALNNKVFSFGEKRVGKNFPPIHANCRCAIIPIINN